LVIAPTAWQAKQHQTTKKTSLGMSVNACATGENCTRHRPQLETKQAPADAHGLNQPAAVRRHVLQTDDAREEFCKSAYAS
jgi:hypothetical protein